MGRPPLFRTAMTATDYQRRWRAKRKKLADRKRALSPAANQPQHDLVMTPPKLAERIVQHFKPRGRVLDPCRGQGAFYNAFAKLPGVKAQWCELAEGRDFFAEHRYYDWIITNPPWSKFRRFLSPRHGPRRQYRIPGDVDAFRHPRPSEGPGRRRLRYAGGGAV